MKKLHKILTLCLTLVMLLSIMPTPASASDDVTYLVWTAEEYWDLSIPRPGEDTSLLILVKPGADENWTKCDDFEPYNGNMYDVTRIDVCDASILRSSAEMKAAALDAYNRIDDPEYRTILVDMFGLDVKTGDTTTPPADTTKPETPTVQQPVTTTTPETTATTTVTSFSDVKPGDWYYTAVTEFAKTGILVGYSDGTFRPNNPITGGELATILCRIYGTTDAELQEMRNTINAHPDSSWMQTAQGTVSINHWALPAMAIAQDSTGNIFNAHMTNYEFNRGNVAQALVNMANLSTWPDGKKRTYDSSDEAIKATIAGIPDVTYNELNVPERTYGFGGDDPLYRDCWDSKCIAFAYQMGIMHGVDSTGRCDPWSKVTRAQLVQMLYNLGITYAGQLERYSKAAMYEEIRNNQEAEGIILGGLSSGASTSK